MKLRTPIIAAGAAVVLGTTGALVLPAVASAHSASTTLKFTAENVAKVSFTKTTGGSAAKDVNSKGKIIGFNVVYAAFGKTSATVNLALTTSGGLLYGTVTTTNGNTYTGKVTGGTGSFTGATGTITAKKITSGKTAVTITYSG
jgi:hypothetical protein